MGYMRHHAILITTYDENLARQALAFAADIFRPVCLTVFRGEVEQEAVTAKIKGIVSELAHSPINSYYSFTIFPDGSKEGWDVSDAGDEARGQLIAWMKTHRFSDGSSPFAWVEVQYGDDNWETRVCRDSDAQSRKSEES